MLLPLSDFLVLLRKLKETLTLDQLFSPHHGELAEDSYLYQKPSRTTRQTLLIFLELVIDPN